MDTLLGTGKTAGIEMTEENDWGDFTKLERVD